MIGSPTTIRSSGVSDNTILDLLGNNVTYVDNVALGLFQIPSANTRPNSEADFLGTNNRMWTVNCRLDMNNIPTNTITFSGLEQLGKTGSDIWFYDEGFTTGSGAWVRVRTITANRTNTYAESEDQVGNVIDYSVQLVETKL